MRAALIAGGIFAGLLVLALGLGHGLPAERIMFLSDQDGAIKLYGMDIVRGLSHKLNDVETTWMYQLSPDEQHILYIEPANTQAKIFVMDFGGDNRHPLVDQHAIKATWSPDSQYIVFIIDDPANHPPQIYRVRADGSDLRALTELAEDVQPLGAFWSPDGHQIVFQATAPNNKISLYIMGADGSDARPLNLPVLFDRLTHPAWSPDGRYLAFVGESLNSALALASTLCVAEVATTVTHCADSNIDSHAAWSPDSASIAFVVTRGYHIYEIHILDVLTAQVRSIRRYGKAVSLQGVGDPIWTRDGQHLIYVLSQVQNKGRVTQLHIINLDGGGERSLANGDFTQLFPSLWTGE
jgi:Tol biopolymer transport system component